MITDNIPGDSVVLTAPETTKPTEKSETRAEERRSYVIRDEDDSDDDDLIDVDEGSERKGKVFTRGYHIDKGKLIIFKLCRYYAKGYRCCSKARRKGISLSQMINNTMILK